MKAKIINSKGNVFEDLGFPPEEASVLAMRAELMASLREIVEKSAGRKLKLQTFLESANREYPT